MELNLIEELQIFQSDRVFINHRVLLYISRVNLNIIGIKNLTDK